MKKWILFFGWAGAVCAGIFFILATFCTLPFMQGCIPALYVFYASAIGMVYFGGLWMVLYDIQHEREEKQWFENYFKNHN